MSGWPDLPEALPAHGPDVHPTTELEVKPARAVKLLASVVEGCPLGVLIVSYSGGEFVTVNVPSVCRVKQSVGCIAYVLDQLLIGHGATIPPSPAVSAWLRR